MLTARRADEEIVRSRLPQAIQSVENRLAKVSWIRQHCPPEFFESLAMDEDWLIRSEAAAADICPPAVQLKLARDPNPIVRAALVKNPAATQEVLNLLWRDKTGTVRLAFEERRRPNPKN